MEGSEGEGEAVFETLNLNPQQFVNEVLNTVDDVVDGAFDHFLHEAENLLQNNGSGRSNDLKKGVSLVKRKVERSVNESLGMWEKYCLLQLFVAPEGFSLPNNKKSPESSPMDLDVISSPELDEELESLRNKLATVKKESSELNKELQELERQSVSRKLCIGSVNEALQFYDQHWPQEKYQEMMKMVSEFRQKVGNMKCKRIETCEKNRSENFFCSNRDTYVMDHSNGLSRARLEDLQTFVADMKSLSN